MRSMPPSVCKNIIAQGHWDFKYHRSLPWPQHQELLDFWRAYNQLLFDVYSLKRHPKYKISVAQYLVVYTVGDNYITPPCLRLAYVQAQLHCNNYRSMYTYVSVSHFHCQFSYKLVQQQLDGQLLVWHCMTMRVHCFKEHL